MPIETFLSIAGFALSAGALVSVVVSRAHRRDIAITIVVAALFATTGIALLRHQQEERLIRRVENEVLSVLSEKELTFDQLYQELHFRQFSIVNEALFRGVEAGALGHHVVQLQRDNGILAVRLYYVASN